MSTLLQRALLINKWRNNPDIFFKDVTGHAPYGYQKEILEWLKDMDNNRKLIVVGGTGGGKALDLNTPILTTKGFRTMDEVVVGDMVFTPGGCPTKITFVSDIMFDQPCYELVFSDSSRIVASGDHLWKTMTARERKNSARRTPEFREKRKEKRRKGNHSHLHWDNIGRTCKYKPPSSGKIRSTEEIFSTHRIGNRTNHSIDVCKPVKLPYRSLPIDPYVLGVWLGDGTSCRPHITIAEDDIVKEIEDRGYHLTRLADPLNWRVNELTRAILLDVGVLNNKRIPEEYLLSSVEQRKELLRGLMDSDGYANDDCEFTTIKEDLARDVYRLITSLGIKTNIVEGKATLNGRYISQKYRLKFLTDIPVFCMTRKLENQKTNGFRGTHNKRYIIEVNRVESVPVLCIKVEHEDGMFLAGESLIPTHNTFLLAAIALWHVICLPPELKKPFRIAIAAGALQQAKRTYDYVMDFCNRSPLLRDWIKGEPLKSEVRFKDNSWIAPIASSSTQLFNLHCYDPETEVYTDQGWKYFTDINGTELFASLSDGHMVFEKPIGILSKFYEGPMYELSTSHLNIKVTEDHNLYVRENWYNNKSETFRLVKARDVVGKQLEFKKNAKWIGHEDPVTIPEYTSHYYSYDKKYKRILSPELYVKLMAWYLSEGHVTTQIRISQSREVHPENCSAIENLITELGHTPSYNGTQYYFSDPQLREYLRQFGTSKHKFIPEAIHNMSPRLIRLFLNTYEMGDGWKRECGHTTLCTSSRRMSDDLQILAIKAGWTADITTVPPKISNINKIDYQSSVHYRISIKKRALTPLFNIRSQQDKITNYRGMVYCVDVPSDLLLVRRKGKVCWAGNSEMFIIDEAAQAGDDVLIHAPRVVGAYDPNRIIISGHFVDTPQCYISSFVDIWTNDNDFPRTGSTNNPHSEWLKVYYTSLDIPWISKSEIDMARKTYSEDEFRTIWEAKLPELTSTLFSVQAIRESRSSDEPKYDGHNPLIMAVDWGFSVSPTAILISEILQEEDPIDNGYNIIYAEEYPQKTGPWLHKEINKIAQKYNVQSIRADSSHSQENYRLRQKGWYVEEMVFRAIKHRMQERLRVLLESHKIKIWRGFDILLKELVAYRLDSKKDDHLVDCLQMVTWQHPKNYAGDFFYVKTKYGKGRRR